ncbi:response regulator [Azospirillum sp. sgz302134]
MDVQARWLDRLISLRPTPAAAQGLALLLVAGAVLARLALDPFVTEVVPFATLFPAVLFATLAGGAAAGITAWIAGGLVAWAFLFPDRGDPDWLPEPDLANIALFSLSCLLMVAVAHRLRATFTRLREDEMRLRATAKREEAERRNIKAELERLVGERTRALEDTNRRLLAEIAERERAEAALARAQRLEAIGQLTGGVAHDFNNLLTVIVGNLDLIARTDEVPERVRRLGAAALSAAERGERLTRQLLAFARRQALHPEIADANRLIQDEEALFRRAVDEAVEIRLDLDDTLKPCRIDVAQFEAALLNLVVNARDATPAGGCITIATRNTVLPAQDAPPDLPAGGYIVVAVQDTGAGIPPEILPRVFEPFFTTKDVGKGSGLGLSQVYGFVRQSGGQVRVDSVVGRGTRVEIWLPCSAERLRVPDAAPTEEAKGLRGNGECVLVVEDDADVRAMAVETLQGLNYRVLVAANGLEGRAALETHRTLDLLFTDVVMPGGIGGLELAQEARRLHPHLRVLLTSGYPARRGMPSDAGNTPETLPFSLLAKPYRRDALAQAVRAALADIPEAEADFSRLRVLVVEDDVLVRMSTIEMLDELQADIAGEAADAEEALSLLDRLGDVDVLLTDLRLPGRDGLALAAEALRRRPTLSVVLATGYGESAIPSDAAAHLQVLSKPFGTEELGRALERVRRVPVG